MSVKMVNEYVEEMCNGCYEHKWGIFVKMNNIQICEECCQAIQKKLQIYELERS